MRYFLSIFFLCFSVWADIFTVRNISVDIVDENASEAKIKAFQLASRRGFNALMRRLIIDEDLEKIPPLSDDELTFLISGIQVQDEKTSQIRYIANVAVSFKQHEIEKMLQENKIPYLAALDKPTLILPLYQKEPFSKYVLWTDNPWKEAWEKSSYKSDTTPLIVPHGDLEDINLYNLDNLENLNLLKKKYETEKECIIYARQDPISDIITFSYTPPRSQEEISFELPVSTSLETAFGQAIGRIYADFETKWREQNSVRFDQSTEITVMIPINNLSEWLSMKNRLDKIALIQKYTVDAMRRDQVQINLFFVGSLPIFIKNLKDNQLFLAPTSYDKWSLRDIAFVSEEEQNNLVLPSDLKQEAFQTPEPITTIPISPIPTVPDDYTGLIEEDLQEL